MSAINITAARLETALEEGFRADAYNDATGKRVTCLPDGNLTWLYGLNLETEGCRELGDLFVRWKLGKIEASLMQYQWYLQADDNRRSVFLDVAFNSGVHGLLGFASMLHYAEAEDWRNAAAQLLDSDAARRRPDRYRPLANILDPLDAPTPMEA